MSNEPSREEVVKSIVPDSTQLNAEDFTTGPQTFTISGVKRGNKDQPIQVELSECNRVYRPCKTCRRILIAVFSDDPKAWVGQRLTLYCDPDVLWAGVRVGGVRISHMTGIDKPKTFLITQTRGKRSEVTIKPLVAISAEDAEMIAQAKTDIAESGTTEALKAVGFVLKQKPKQVQDAVRSIYAARQKELSEPPRHREPGEDEPETVET